MIAILKRLQAARTALLLDHPFFGVLALQLRLMVDDSCKTAYTNGRDIAFSSAFVQTLSQDELTGVFAHEVLHCAAGHQWRRDGRTPRKWNTACDYAINGILVDGGFTLPSSALLDAQFSGHHSEWIYDRLPDEPEDDTGDSGSGDGDGSSMGDVRDAPTDGDGDAPSESDWQQTAKQSAALAQAQGKLPAHLQRQIDDALTPAVDWRATLRRYLQDYAQNDYTWTRPNPRYCASGLYLPSLRSIECGRIVIAIDTSGSIDTVLLSQFASELRSIFDELQPSGVDVVYCDSQVHRIDTFARGDALTLDPVGGGGTAFAPAFDAITNLDEQPRVCVYFTDLDGSFPDVEPDYPVIWAAYGRNHVAPFGDVIPCE